MKGLMLLRRFGKSIGRGHRRLLVILGCVLLIALIVGAYFKWPSERARHGLCYFTLKALSVDYTSLRRRVTEGEVTQQELDGLSPLVAVIEVYDLPPSWLLYPGDRRFRSKLPLEGLSKDSIFYETWDWSTLSLFDQVPCDTLLMWEKRPTHKGKRLVCSEFGVVTLVDDETFEAMIKNARKLVAQARATKREAASQDTGVRPENSVRR